MHIPGRRLGRVFLSGVIFLVLTAAGIRQMILHAIRTSYTPRGRRHRPVHRFHRLPQRWAGGWRPQTLVTLAISATQLPRWRCGIILMVALEVRKSAPPFSSEYLPSPVSHGRSADPLDSRSRRLSRAGLTAFKLDIRGALNTGLLEIVFVSFLWTCSTISERWWP